MATQQEAIDAQSETANPGPAEDIKHRPDAASTAHPDTLSVDLEKYDTKAFKTSGFKLAALAFSTLGIIYSDIGTSPLYVLNGIWPSSGDAPSEQDVIGGLSAIIWAITLIPLIKYVGFALEFGTTAGEGGPFALFMTMFPSAHPRDDRSLTGYLTTRSGGPVPASTSRLDKLKRWRWPLLMWTVFGTALTLSDGILTPAVSVTSAVGGIAVADASVINSVVPISIAFLLVFFAVQPFGTQKLSFCLAPITAIWLGLLGACGIYNITMHPGIFRAFDPSRAIMWFVRTKDYDALSGVLLAITGCEAMFANLGQFNKASIRLGFGLYVYPMLILAYLGQGARLIATPEVISSVFYRTIPGETGGALYWIVFVFAILATLIASQAMVTATFSLLHQLIGMHAFPALRITHTSATIAGQIYIAPINWLLMIGTIAVVGGFGSSTALTLAYGFAVATVLFVTTTLIALSVPFVKNLPYILGLAFLLVFGFLDGLFWGASLRKVPHGAWFPLALGGVLWAIMVFWAWCRSLESDFEDANLQSLRQILSSPGIQDNDDVQSSSRTEKVYLDRGDGRGMLELQRIPIIAVFHRNDSSGRGVPHGFAGFLQRYPVLPQVVIFLTTRIVGVPHVPSQDRYIVNKVRSFDGVFAVTMRVGYLDTSPLHIPDLMPTLLGMTARSSSPAHVEALERVARDVTHVIPAYAMASRPSGNRLWRWVRAFMVEAVYARARVIFPDWSNAPSPSEGNVVHVAIPALI